MRTLGVVLLSSLLVGCQPATAPVHAVGSAAGLKNPTEGLAQLEELVRKGEQYLAKQDFVSALTTFKAAAAIDLFEVPNYEVLVRVAEVQCHLGMIAEAHSVLVDFRCMIDVDLGRRRCYLDSGPGELGRRNTELSAECFRRMCAEIYLPYYEDRSSETQQEIKKMESDAKRVEGLCARITRGDNS